MVNFGLMQSSKEWQCFMDRNNSRSQIKPTESSYSFWLSIRVCLVYSTLCTWLCENIQKHSDSLTGSFVFECLFSFTGYANHQIDTNNSCRCCCSVITSFMCWSDSDPVQMPTITLSSAVGWTCAGLHWSRRCCRRFHLRRHPPPHWTTSRPSRSTAYCRRSVALHRRRPTTNHWPHGRVRRRQRHSRCYRRCCCRRRRRLLSSLGSDSSQCLRCSWKRSVYIVVCERVCTEITNTTNRQPPTARLRHDNNNTTPLERAGCYTSVTYTQHFWNKHSHT